MTPAIKAVTTTCWHHVRMPPGPRCASAVGKRREWWRGSLAAMSAPAYAPTCTSYYSSSQGPRCVSETISYCYALKRGQKSHKVGGEKWNCCKVLANYNTFLQHCTSSVMWIEKGQGIVDDCPFLCLNTRIHIFTQCPWFNGSDRLGARFCFCTQSRLLLRTDLGHWDHKEGTSDECGDNKSTPPPPTLIPFISNETMKEQADWCIRLHHLEYPTPCHSISYQSIRVLSSSRAWSVSYQSGILSSSKVLLRRLIVTFLG